jgi:hypothetical protein
VVLCLRACQGSELIDRQADAAEDASVRAFRDVLVDVHGDRKGVGGVRLAIMLVVCL